MRTIAVKIVLTTIAAALLCGGCASQEGGQIASQIAIGMVQGFFVGLAHL